MPSLLSGYNELTVWAPMWSQTLPIGSLDSFSSLHLKDIGLATVLSLLHFLYRDHFQHSQVSPLIRVYCQFQFLCSSIMSIIIIFFYKELSVCIVATSSSPILPWKLSTRLSSSQLYQDSSCQIHWRLSCCQGRWSNFSPHHLTQLITLFFLKQFFSLRF